jgi:hypothetical protein
MQPSPECRGNSGEVGMANDRAFFNSPCLACGLDCPARRMACACLTLASPDRGGRHVGLGPGASPGRMAGPAMPPEASPKATGELVEARLARASPTARKRILALPWSLRTITPSSVPPTKEGVDWVGAARRGRSALTVSNDQHHLVVASLRSPERRLAAPYLQKSCPLRALCLPSRIWHQTMLLKEFIPKCHNFTKHFARNGPTVRPRHFCPSVNKQVGRIERSNPIWTHAVPLNLGRRMHGPAVLCAVRKVLQQCEVWAGCL